MREILFRGKRNDNGEWIIGGYYHGEVYNLDEIDIHYIIPSCDLYDEDLELVDVIPETVGQYTGLKDKNGKRIFEGDILFSSYIADSPSIEVVKWIYNGWHTQEGDLTPDMIDDVGIMPYSEVIGNVHDNPGLMRGE